MKKRSLALLACLLGGCSSPPPPATPQTFSTYNTQANHEKQIALEGYLRLAGTALVTDTILLNLLETPDPKAKRIAVSLSVGSSANQAEAPPKNYTEKDLKVHANDGSLIEAQQKVRVSGKFIYSPDSSILFAPVDIQKI